jgi:hypothetical protein
LDNWSGDPGSFNCQLCIGPSDGAVFVHHMLSEHRPFSFHSICLEAEMIVFYPLFIFYMFSLVFPVQSATPPTLVCSAVYFVVAAAIIWRGRNRRIDGSVEI